MGNRSVDGLFSTVSNIYGPGVSTHYKYTCQGCGKQFIPTTEHVYKHKGQPVCRWSCLVKLEKLNKTYNRKSFRDTSVW